MSVLYDDYLIEVYVVGGFPHEGQVLCVYEKHAGLTPDEARELEYRLSERVGGGGVFRYTIEKAQPDWYTIGLSDTFDAILEAVDAT